MSKLKGVAEYEDEEEGEDEEIVHTVGERKGVRKMVKEDPVSYTQLATRVDSTLFRRIKIHCVETSTSIMEFVHQALVNELKRRKK
jgi:hypothetical protein